MLKTCLLSKNEFTTGQPVCMLYKGVLTKNKNLKSVLIKFKKNTLIIDISF